MKDILDIEEEMIINEATVDDLYQQLCQGVPIASPFLLPSSIFASLTQIPQEGPVDLYEKGVRIETWRIQGENDSAEICQKGNISNFL